MLKLLRSMLFATMLACGSAHAVLINMGANPVDESVVNSFPAVPGGSTFLDTVLFSVSQASGLVTTAFSNWPVATAGLRNLTFQLFQGSTLVASAGPSAVTIPGGGIPVFTLQSLSEPLASGAYRLTLAGDVRPDGGFYSWTVSTVPVPEPEQWALLMTGLALVAGVAARRRKTNAA